MKQASFTAKELFGMAYLMKKRKMYGIPDAMGEARQRSLQAAFDELISQNIADMDMDGQVTLRSEYFALVSTYCDCQKCLTINVRTEDKMEHSFIFWLRGAECAMAEVIADRYVFSQMDADVFKAMVVGFLCTGNMKEAPTIVVIPQLEIVKAKRACVKGDYTEAIRIIRQGGATSTVSNAIVAGLQGNAYYLGLVYMDIRNGDCQKQDMSYICNDGVLLSLGQTVTNLRTCATFTPIKYEDMRKAVTAVVDSFSKKEA